jgi:hypothetical protein
MEEHRSREGTTRLNKATVLDREDRVGILEAMEDRNIIRGMEGGMDPRVGCMVATRGCMEEGILSSSSVEVVVEWAWRVVLRWVWVRVCLVV